MTTIWLTGQLNHNSVNQAVLSFCNCKHLPFGLTFSKKIVCLPFHTSETKLLPTTKAISPELQTFFRLQEADVDVLVSNNYFPY